MKVSLNWLKQYIPLNETPEQISELLTDLGLEIEGYETTGGLRNTLHNVVTGHVLACERIDESDHLSLTKVDIGSGDPLSIVCGASNVAAGQKVVVAKVGATLVFNDGKKLTISERQVMKKYLSQGMICAEDELGIGDDHTGIIVLPADTPVGKPAAEIFATEEDTVFEIGLTPNRSDAMCHIGVARDLAARLSVSKTETAVNMPDISAFKTDSNALSIQVSVEDTEGCPRYSGVCIKGVKITESPDWLKKRLQAIGVNTRNNVVDITNFILHELGQPLHAFDYDKIKNQAIIVKTLPSETPFLSLKKNESGEYVTLKLTGEDLMICDGEGTGMCIAGVIGNPTEGVSETTTNIFLESAHFNPKRLRRSSFYHNTRTDAAKTFEKGTDPNLTLYALKRAALMIKAFAGGEIASDVIDIYPKPIDNQRIKIDFRNVENLIGQKFDNRYLKKILAALNFNIIETIDNETVVVSIPTNKPDVTREADVIEEILRIHGYNNVPMPSYIRSAIVPTEAIDRTKLRNLVSDLLAANGFNEAMGLSLSQSRWYQETDIIDNQSLVYLANPANVHLDIMRPTMVFSALETIAHNQNRQLNDVRVFEFGKTYQLKKTDNGALDIAFEETPRLSVAISGNKTGESWRVKNIENVDFFTLKTTVNALLRRLGISAGFQESAVSDNQLAFGLRYHRGSQDLVVFGKVQTKLRKYFDVKQEVYFADFHWENIIKALKNTKITYEEVSKYPSVRRDLALVLDASVKFSDIVTLAQKQVKKLLKDVNLFDVFEDESKLGAGKKSYAVSFVFEDKEKTMQDKHIETIMDDLIKLYETKLNALIRR